MKTITLEISTAMRDLKDLQKDSQHHHKKKANQKSIITRETIEQFVDFRINRKSATVHYDIFINI